jgi:hypothetical protein
LSVDVDAAEEARLRSRWDADRADSLWCADSRSAHCCSTP